MFSRIHNPPAQINKTKLPAFNEVYTNTPFTYIQEVPRTSPIKSRTLYPPGAVQNDGIYSQLYAPPHYPLGSDKSILSYSPVVVIGLILLFILVISLLTTMIWAIVRSTDKNESAENKKKHRNTAIGTGVTLLIIIILSVLAVLSNQTTNLF